MNIVEEYLKLNNQIIIAVSGLYGTHKTNIASQLAEKFKMNYINLNKYYLNDYHNIEKISVNSDIVDFVNYKIEDSIDWEKFNKDVNIYINTGIIISGISFPNNKINFTIDYHILLKINKKTYFDNIINRIEKEINKKSIIFTQKYMENYKIIEKDKMNKFILPDYYQSIKNSDITEFLIIDEPIIQINDIYSLIFDKIMIFIIIYFEKNKI
jgi:uridine kinase